MKYNRIFLIMVAIIVIIFIGLIIFFLVTNRSLETSPNDPLPSRIPTSLTPSANSLQILQILPIEKVTGDEGYSGIQQITVRFNKEISPADISVSISPPLTFRKESGSVNSELKVYPEPPNFWVPDTVYTVSIQSGSQAIDGSVLQNSQTYRIKSIIPRGGV